jgi:hypothetical protein
MERMNYLMCLDDKQKSDVVTIDSPSIQQPDTNIKITTSTTDIKKHIPYYMLAGGLLLIFFS